MSKTVSFSSSHGLNAGLGTSGQPSFPAKFNPGPTQAARMANSTRCPQSPAHLLLLRRFSPADWSASNSDHYNHADASRNNSERVRNEAVRLMREREDKTVMTQRDADRRIGERIGDEVRRARWKTVVGTSGRTL